MIGPFDKDHLHLDPFQPDTSREFATEQEKKEKVAEEYREAVALNAILESPGGKILLSRLNANASVWKSRLYRYKLDNAEHTSGKIAGWLEALEWVLNQLTTRPKEGSKS
jgi:hypothetical protein